MQNAVDDDIYTTAALAMYAPELNRKTLRQKFHSSVENDIEELRTEKNSKMLQDRWAPSLELHESSNKDREK